jgi:RNA polymerase sigma-70 factor, ECF subfamily
MLANKLCDRAAFQLRTRRNGCEGLAFFEAPGAGERQNVMTPDKTTTRPRALSEAPNWRDEVVSLIPALRAFAWSLCHNASDADDLVQDTLIKAWTNREKFEPGTNLRAWLFTILRNTYYTAVLRRRREVRDETGEYASTLKSAPTQDWSVAVHSLQEALLKLPDEHREALVLVGAAGLSYEEAAEICGCALGTIKSRVNRARARLLKIMDANEATDVMALETLPVAGRA